LLVTAKAQGRPIVVRLFDAGGDKPLVWLGAQSDPARGIRRLLANPDVLSTQMRAIARASEHADVRVLLPVVDAAEEVEAIRRLAPPRLKIGAMIESPDAVGAIDSIASVADFLSIGTNDLTATAFGLERTMDAPKNHPHVLELVGRVIATARARGREVSICGEMVGDEHGARLAVGLGVDALSVAPPRVAAIRRALARATRESCRAELEGAMGGSTFFAPA
jgi:phosphoenolpyruvate-protein kinase (PTS system EI component)